MFEQSICPESKFRKMKICLICPLVAMTIGLLGVMVDHNLLGYVLIAPLYPGYLVAMLIVHNHGLPPPFFIVFSIVHFSFYGGGCYLVLRFLEKRQRTKIALAARAARESVQEAPVRNPE
jgi:hypothetical protein